MYIRVKVNRIDQTESVSSRYIAGLDPDQTIGNIVPQLLETGENLDGLDITCVYCGEVLDLNKSLGECEIDSFSILQFIIKPKAGIPSAKTPRHSLTEVSQTMANLHWLIRSGRLYKLIQLLSQRDWIDQAILSHPEIGRDTTAYSILQDPKFLSVVLRDQGILDKLIAVYPCILSALRLATQSLSSLNENFQTKPVSHRNVMTSTTSLGSQDYTVDQNLEDDAEDDTDTNAPRQPSGSSPVLLTPYGGPGEPNPDSFTRTAQSTGPNPRERNSVRVSRHQLQAAIAQAQGLLSGSGLHIPPPSSSQVATGQVSGSSTSPTTNSATPRITSSALSQALASVPSLTARQNLPTTSSSSTAASHTAESVAVHTENRWATQLGQLAEMGVTDELAARQALEATNGDIAMAVQLLFG